MSKLKAKLPKDGGFTIIEVVLVLAIAGLIFLIVFIALPQLQRRQRDSHRQSDIGRILTELENYAGNNNGRYPETPGSSDTFEDFIGRYFAGLELNDPSTGESYNYYNDASTDPDINTSDVQYVTGYKCNGESLDSTSRDRDVALRIALESGEVFACRDNAN